MRSRVLVITLLIGSLVLTAASRHWAIDRRMSAMHIPGQPAAAAGQGRASLAGMNSYALALLLGGLRGPLVMILWQQSESQKSARNLEGVDTMIEWIRLLQPEFDTVHLFQIWNKAYNISVQMASLANKYAVILDAIEYARSLDREKPNNINITYAIGQTFFDKLGNSAEKEYYRRRVREETMYRAPDKTTSARGVGFRGNRLEPMLDPEGNLLKDLVTPTTARPADLSADSMWNNGAPMQYIEPYQPFPQGVSPFAIAYDYFKRAQGLQRVSGQRHIQVSDMVVDSRPALALKVWSEEEWERGRRFELAALGLRAPEERLDMEGLSADLSPDTVLKNSGEARDALYSYAMATRLAQDAIPAYEDHLKIYAINFSTYQSHIAHLRGEALLTRADELYLRAILTADAQQKKSLLAQAGKLYEDSIRQFERVVLRFFTADELLDAVSMHQVTKADIERLPAAHLDALMAARARYVQQVMHGQDPNGEDAGEYMTYIARAAHRLNRIEQALGQTAPDK